MELDFELIENDADTFILSVTWNDHELILKGEYHYLVVPHYQSDDYGNMQEEFKSAESVKFEFTDIEYFVSDNRTHVNLLSALFIEQVQKLATNFLTQNVNYNGL